jgi:hypothetical protein
MKAISEGLAEDQISLRRFKHMGEVLAQLQQIFIVCSYRLIQTGDLPSLLMDFIEGNMPLMRIFNSKRPDAKSDHKGYAPDVSRLLHLVEG